MVWELIFLITIITLNVLRSMNVITSTNKYVNWGLLIGSVVGLIISFNMMYNSYTDDIKERSHKEKQNLLAFERNFPQSKREYGVGMTNRNYTNKLYPESRLSM